MKKITLHILTVVAFAASAQAQKLSSDDPSFQHNVSAKALQVSAQGPAISTVIAVSSTNLPCGGGNDTLVATGMTCTYLWSTDSLGMNVISTSDSAFVGPINSDTTFYLTTTEAGMDSLAPLPPHSSNYSGNVRGYYFTAPVDFIMTGLYVPTDAGTGAQNVEVLLFDNQTPPPAWSATTNAFTSLGYWSNYSATDTIKVCFPISAGDVIGVYGTRADINSYAGGPYNSEIGGIMTTFNRTGMQYPLSSNQMFDVFSEPSGSISRTEFYYDLAFDSIVTTIDITVSNNEYTSTSSSICQGDSIYAEGAYQTTSGIYIDTLQTASGCDSIVELDLTVNALPTVSLLADTLCVQAASITLNGSPAGGTYSGAGVSGSLFDPSVAGIGSHPVTYVYSDSSGCANSAVANIVVDGCAGVDENTLIGVKVYPNPMDEFIEIVLPDGVQSGSAQLYDAKGSIVYSWNLTSSHAKLNVSEISAGIYTIEIKDINGLKAQFRVVKK